MKPNFRKTVALDVQLARRLTKNKSDELTMLRVIAPYFEEAIRRERGWFRKALRGVLKELEGKHG